MLSGAVRWFGLDNACNLKCMCKEMRQRRGEAEPRNGGLIARLKSAAFV